MVALAELSKGDAKERDKSIKDNSPWLNAEYLMMA